MSEFRSKCCGAKVYIWAMVFVYFCSECHKPTEIEEKKEEEK